MSTSFLPPQEPPRTHEHPLARAFASFTEAAGSLERAYGLLQQQVPELRRELEVTNRNLASSLAEKHRILEGLPCGVLVIETGKPEAKTPLVRTRICVLNPEAVRMLGRKFEVAAE